MNEVFWVRLFCSEFDDPRWHAIEQMPDADAVQIMYVRMLMLAGRSNADGLLLLHESLPYDVTTLSAVLRRTVPVVQFALATLEKFKFIEVVDSVIAIAEWDRLQPTDELSRLAVRREKDKLRKRLEREEKRSQLLLASADSPQMSCTIKLDTESDTTTAVKLTPTREKAVVDTLPGNQNPVLQRLLNKIPAEVRSKRIVVEIEQAISRHGEAMAASNIDYAKKNHDPQQGRLGGLILDALRNDYTSEERKSRDAKEVAQVVASVRREAEEAAGKDKQERERREALSRKAAWLNLPEATRLEFEIHARKNNKILEFLGAEPLNAILADLYADGKFQTGGNNADNR